MKWEEELAFSRGGSRQNFKIGKEGKSLKKQLSGYIGIQSLQLRSLQHNIVPVLCSLEDLLSTNWCLLI